MAENQIGQVDNQGNLIPGTIPPPPAGVDMSKFAAYKAFASAPPVPPGVDMSKFSAYKASLNAPSDIATGSEESEPGFWGGLGAGVVGKTGEGAGHFIGSALPQTVGAIAGIPFGPAGSVIGAEIGQVGQEVPLKDWIGAEEYLDAP